MAARLQFGIQTGLDGVAWADLVGFWRFLDKDTAYDSVWTYDHFVPPAPGQDAHGDCFEGWTALAAAAESTRRLRLGCLVSGNTYRHPAVLAKMACTVDHISDGRLVFGLGAGWHEGEHEAYGIPFYTVRERQDRMEEAAALIRLLFQSEGPVDFEGRYYRLQAAPFAPRPKQRPHPPIMIGGGGERRTLRTVALHGDMMNVSGPLSDVRHKIEVLERHCADVGRDPREITKTAMAPVICSEDPQRIDRFSRLVSSGMGVPLEKVRTEMPIGNAARVREILESYIEIGVSMILSPAQAPYPVHVYEHISEEVVTYFQ